jgi:hypothetical protein
MRARVPFAFLGVPGVFLLGGLLTAALLCGGCTRAETAKEEPAKPAEAPPPEPPKPPPPKPIELAPLNPVRLDPGETATVGLQVERNENEGAIEVALSGVPDGVTATALEIPDGESAGELALAAAQKLGDEELKATITVNVKVGEQEAEEPLELAVNKIRLPSLQPVSQIILQPGAKKAVELSIERNDFEGPLELRVEELPEKLGATVQPVAADESATTVEIAAAADAPDGAQTIRVATTLYGRTIDVKIPVQVDRRPYQVKSFMVVTLTPGETKPVEIPVERRSYKGPVSLEIAGLPEGVSANQVELPPKQAKAAFQLVAAADAEPGVRSAKVVSAGGTLKRTDPLVVRVSQGDTFLPDEFVPDADSAFLLRRGSFGGRLTAERKRALLDAYGGTEESEEAILLGLRWLAAHQRRDGSWSLNEYWKDVPGCDCYSEFEKEVDDSVTAGTAFGVLPFLGAGVTHKSGPESPRELVQYRKRVFSAIAYLTQHQVRSTDSKKAGHLGGNMYSHALGTMALCEAYGLSEDDRLKVPAQLAVKYMTEAQHKEGGWRYNPGQPGDMSVTAWVFLAIRSAQLAGLPIGRSSLIRAERFVDSCAVGPEGATLSRYAYQPPTPEKEQPAKLTLSGAGLLTRQYLGWNKDDPELLAGCRYLMQNLPPESDKQLGQIYYYHYATQVLHHMEGSDFDLWNHRMREHLIRTQEKQGHRAGSWNPEGTDWGKRGGRLYATGMSLLTLQVYYRHLPMYRPVRRTSN